MTNFFLHISLLLFLFAHSIAYCQDEKQLFLNNLLLENTVKQDKEQVLLLLNKGADIEAENEWKATPLLLATEKNNLEIVKLLLERKADPNKSTTDRFTALMMGVYNGNLDIVELLIKSGANTNFVDDQGASALHYAVAFGDFVMSDMLLFYGADANICTYDESNNVHLAAFSPDTNLTNLFISRGLPFDTLNSKGFSPIMIAACNGYAQIVKLLLDKGANPSITNFYKLSALDYAIYFGNEDVVKVISEHKNLKVDNSIIDLYHPLVIAREYHNRNMIKNLKDAGYSTHHKLLIDAMTYGMSSSFNQKDYLISFVGGIHEVNFDLYLSMNYSTRFKSKQVYTDYRQSEYLLWEHRRILSIEAQKYFPIVLNNKSKVYASAGVDLQLVFGKYDGLSRKIPKKIIPAPELGLVFSSHYIEVGLFYVYTHYNIIDIPNSRIKFSMIGKLPFYTKPTKYKLAWI